MRNNSMLSHVTSSSMFVSHELNRFEIFGIL